jgi:chemotaxis signal transduction protein
MADAVLGEGKVRRLQGPMTSIATLTSPAQHYCLFRRGELDFALPARVARRAVPAKPLTRVPFAPADLCGVFLDRRRVFPVVLLDRWLGLPAPTTGAGAAWLVIDDGNVALAGVVDRVLGVVSLADRAVERAVAQPLASGMVADGSQTVVLLDAARLIAAVSEDLVAALADPARAS